MTIADADSALSTIVHDNEQLQRDGPGPARALVLSGLPLAGKSHLVNQIQKMRPDNFLVVRSDYVRPAVARSLGRKRPAFDAIEHATTFIVASEVVRLALTLNWPVICDATNLKEEFRRWAYEPVDALKAEVLVVFLEVSDEVVMDRLTERKRSGSYATFEVYQKLKYEKESIDKCSRPYLAIQSVGDMRPYAKELAKWLAGEIQTVKGTKMPKGMRVQMKKKDKEKRMVYDFYTGEKIEV